MGIHVDALPISSSPEFILVEDQGTVRKMPAAAFSGAATLNIQPIVDAEVLAGGFQIRTEAVNGITLDLSKARGLVLTLFAAPLNGISIQINLITRLDAEAVPPTTTPYIMVPWYSGYVILVDSNGDLIV